METGQLKLLKETLDDIKHQNGVEFWYGREIFQILGYSNWDNFKPVIERAKNACKNSGGEESEHFIDQVLVNKESGKEYNDVKLTRFACYLIAINGDTKKEEIAFAQAYFITQTRKIELLQQNMNNLQRIDSREKLKITEKDFSDMLYARGVDGQGIGTIRAKGDKALFGGENTSDIKNRLGIPKKTPLADHLPNITLKAKDFATAMTSENARKKNLTGEETITKEHVSNNESVRRVLVEGGIYPEKLPIEENVKEIEKKHRKELKEMRLKHQKELKEASIQKNERVED